MKGFGTTMRRGWRTVFKDRRVAYLTIEGVIAEQKALSSGPRTLDLLEDVRKQEFKALVIRVNSPGGTVGASQAIYDALMKLRLEDNVKIVASLGDVAASGGLYVAMAADRVVSHGGTVTGSIGVIIKSGNFRELLDKIGIRSDVVKSGKFKDILSAERAMTDEEKAILQETIDDTYEQFVSVVARGRKLSPEAVRAFADGRVFSGRQAQVLGLVDALGGKAEAVRLARELAGIPLEGPPLVVELEGKKPLLKRMLEGGGRLGTRSGSALDAWLPGVSEALRAHGELSGIPLWLMPSRQL